MLNLHIDVCVYIYKGPSEINGSYALCLSH